MAQRRLINLFQGNLRQLLPRLNVPQRLNVRTALERTNYRMLREQLPPNYFNRYPVDVRRLMILGARITLLRNPNNESIGGNLHHFWVRYQDNREYFGMSEGQWDELQDELEIVDSEPEEDSSSEEENEENREPNRNQGSGRMIHQFPLFFY
tara:strand:- start:369 stop:824 length:456 start_codon:yes stop_codon:yes gene_type:complete